MSDQQRVTAMLVLQLQESKKDSPKPKKPLTVFPKWNDKMDTLPVWLPLLEVYKKEGTRNTHCLFIRRPLQMFHQHVFITSSPTHDTQREGFEVLSKLIFPIHPQGILMHLDTLYKLSALGDR